MSYDHPPAPCTGIGIPRSGQFDPQAFEAAITALLCACGVAPEGAHTGRTPQRVRELWERRLLGGYAMDPAQALGEGFADPRADLVIVRGIAVHGVCPHHLVPFRGELVGIDALSYKDRLTLEATRSIREDYLHQNAFHEVDTYTSPAKQAMLLRLIIGYYEKSLDALSKDASFNKLAALPVREDIGRFKYTEEDKCAERYEEITAKLNAEIRELTEGGEA